VSFTASRLLQYWAKLYGGTPAELALEPAVASLGVPYRFQHPVWALGVFPDFVLLRERVVIEVDDAGHRRAAKKKADAERTAKLQKAGWRVVRCTNEQALAAPYDTVDRMMEELGLPFRTTRGD
jgi:very-short-patch-repair endonuclease